MTAPPDEQAGDDRSAILADLEVIGAEARRRIEAATTPEELREAVGQVLGKRSAFATLQRRLGGLDADGRREVGALINAARTGTQDLADQHRSVVEAAAARQRAQAERLDLTEAVGRARSGATQLGARHGRGRAAGLRGHLHLVTQTRQELEDTFVAMGFTVAEGPEAETDWYNFEALNMPPDHPARGMWDTLYLDLGDPGTVLLRTHTSPVQVRLMEATAPPIFAVMPGRCYRRDTPDARHLPVFHQIEGLVVDRGITFGDLAGTIEAFTTTYFGPGMTSRLRPSFFPFTEPSAEMDVTCPICSGTGVTAGPQGSRPCRTCTGSGWLELGGCGMVDPKVFAACGIDPEVYSGFAFGFGIDRLAQVRSQLADMRILIDNDVRFLSQF